MMYKVLIPQDVAETGKQYLRDQGYEVVLGSGWDKETIKREVVDADALLVRTAPYPAEVLEAGKKLKVIGRFGVGYDNIDIKRAAELGIWVGIAQGANAMSVAEHTIGFMMACAHNTVLAYNEMKNNNFAIRTQFPGLEMHGKTMGIIGVGTIGSLVAEKAAKGFGMKVIGYDIAYGDPNRTFPDYVTFKDNMDDLLKEADVITVHTPLDEKTRNLIGTRELNLMKKDAIVINCARGGIINEDDLYEALKANRIYGAAMDVFTSEPMDPNCKLFTLKNFTGSPHYAALTREANEAVSLAAAKAIDAVLKGGKPAYPVNNPLLYK